MSLPLVSRLYNSITSFLRSLTYSPIWYLLAALAVLFIYSYLRPFREWPDYYWFIIPAWRFHYKWDPIIGLLAAGLLLVASRSFRRYQRGREKSILRESKHTTCNFPAVKSLILSLRRRALGLRLASWFILCLTFASILLGLYIFTSAGDIARRDIYSYQLEDTLRYRERDLREQISLLRERVDASNAENKPLAIEELQKLGAGVQTSTEEVRASLQKMDQIYGSNERLLFFISATSTRVGSILMLIFLVQILLSVYRYSIRMVSYYEARADALLLFAGHNAEQLQSFVNTLSADKVEFGKAPASPAEQTIELIKSLSALQK